MLQHLFLNIMPLLILISSQINLVKGYESAPANSSYSPPLITTSRVTIKLLDVDKNWSAYCQLLQDPKVLEQFSHGLVRTDKELDHLKGNIVHEQDQQTPFTTYQIMIQDTLFGGSIRLDQFSEPYEDKAELSYLICPQYWNLGYGSEALMAFCGAYLPNLKRVNTLWAITPKHNLASQKILLKLGFTIKNSNTLYNFEDPEYEYIFT